MVISYKKFSEMGADNAKNRILAFLKKESDKAFEYKELAKLLNENERTINAYLSMMKNEGKVLHKHPYWAYNRDSPESTSSANSEKNTMIKVIPSMFRHESNGVFSYKSNPAIKLNLKDSIKMVEKGLAECGFFSQNIGGFYYLLRKRVGLLNGRELLKSENTEIIKTNEREKPLDEKLPARHNSKKHKMVSQIMAVYDYIKKGYKFQTAVKNISGDCGVEESTIRDACTRRLGINTRRFIALAETKELEQFLREKNLI